MPIHGLEDEASVRNALGEYRKDFNIRRQFSHDLKDSTSHMAKWRRMAKRYYNAYGDDPWEAVDKSQAKELLRPLVNFNFSLGTINALIGADQSERREVRFVPVGTDARDGTIAEIATRVLRHQFQKVRGHRLQSLVQLDQLITGYGYSEGGIETRRFPFQLSLDHIEPYNVYPDPDAKQDNLVDSRFFIVKSYWRWERIKATFPRKAALLGSQIQHGKLGTSMTPRHVSADYDDPENRTHGENQLSTKYPIYRYFYKRPGPAVSFTDPDTGEDAWLSLKEFRQREKDDARYQELEATFFVADYFYRAILGSSTGDADLPVMLRNEPFGIERFPVSCATGFRHKNVDTGRVQFFGLMHVIYQPQLWSAKVLSQIIEMIGRGVKGGYMFTENAVDDIETFRNEISKPVPAILVKSLQDADMKFLPTMPWPHALGEILRLTQNAIPDTSLVTNYLKGSATQERSNVLVSNLQTQNLAALNPIMDPMNGYRIEEGLTLGMLASKFLPSGLIDRIIGEMEVPGVLQQEDPANTGQVLKDENGQPVPLARPSDLFRNANLWDYDIEVDTGTASPTAKQQFWRMFVDTALLQKLLELEVPIEILLPKFIEFSPLPPEMSKPLAAELRAALETKTLDRILTALSKLSPEEHQQAFQALQQMLEQEGQVPGEPGGPEQAGGEAGGGEAVQ